MVFASHCANPNRIALNTAERNSGILLTPLLAQSDTHPFAHHSLELPNAPRNTQSAIKLCGYPPYVVHDVALHQQFLPVLLVFIELDGTVVTKGVPHSVLQLAIPLRVPRLSPEFHVTAHPPIGNDAPFDVIFSSSFEWYSPLVPGIVIESVDGSNASV